MSAPWRGSLRIAHLARAAVLCVVPPATCPPPQPTPAPPPSPPAASPPAAPAAPSAPASVPSDAAALEARVNDLVNAHRRSAGLSALAYDPRIAAVARAHSADMAAGHDAFGHAGFDARAQQIGQVIPYSTVAENVAFNDYPIDQTAQQAVAGWLTSPGHRRNIEGAFDVTGIGVARRADGTYFYTQIFVRRRGSAGGSP